MPIAIVNGDHVRVTVRISNNEETGSTPMKVLWETEFRQQLNDVLKKHQITANEIIDMEGMLNQIGYRETLRCKLLIEVVDDWQRLVSEMLQAK